MCGTLCCISIGCEAVSGILIWCPIPGKIVPVSALKRLLWGVKSSGIFVRLILLHHCANLIPISTMKLFTFDSQHLDVDWISFNIQGLTDPKTIASNLSKYFTPHILMDVVLGSWF